MKTTMRTALGHTGMPLVAAEDSDESEIDEIPFSKRNADTVSKNPDFEE